MKIRRGIPGSGIGQSLYFPDREIEKMCLEALRKGKLMPDQPGPIDIEALVESYFGASLDLGTDLGDGILGWTAFGSSGEILLVGVAPTLANDTTTVGSRRFRATVAHEAGHCLMHPILFMGDQTPSLTGNLDFQQNRILCRKGDFNGSYDGRWWEVQANKAIGEFLLPKQLVRMAVKPFLTTKGRLGIDFLETENRQHAVQHIADTFEVNLTPARIRLEALFPESEEGFL